MDKDVTASEHGSSAALRAQVIEECAKVAEEFDSAPWNEETGTLTIKSASSTQDGIAEAIRSLSAVSAISQERDVGEHTPTPWRAGGPPLWTHYGEKWRAKHLVLGPDGQVVANTYTEAERDPETDANTSLIVSAVNAYAPMLKALRKIADLRYVEDANEPFDEALDIADAALASLQREALGETPVE